MNFTPLHELDGIITPNGLCFERHHAGIADVDPAADLFGGPCVLVVGALDLPGRADDVVVDAGRAYLVDGDLRVVDVTDPASPRETGFYDVPGPSPWPHVAVEGRLVVLSAQGTSVLDGPDPGAPRAAPFTARLLKPGASCSSTPKRRATPLRSGAARSTGPS